MTGTSGRDGSPRVCGLLSSRIELWELFTSLNFFAIVNFDFDVKVDKWDNVFVSQICRYHVLDISPRLRPTVEALVCAREVC